MKTACPKATRSPQRQLALRQVAPHSEDNSPNSEDYSPTLIRQLALNEGLDGGGGGVGGSGIHYSLKNLPIIHLIKIFAYSLKSFSLFIKNVL